MGACDIWFEVPTTRNESTAVRRARVETALGEAKHRARIEHGTDPYNGDWNNIHGLEPMLHLPPFKSRAAAIDFLAEKVEKRSGAVVLFMNGRKTAMLVYALAPC